jgi:signal transduction histidine kinase
VKRRIVVAIVTVAVLAVLAFGVPLGVVLDREFESQALLRLERAAILAERDIPADWMPGDPPEIEDPAGDVVFGVYDASGARVFGVGPEVGDPPVAVALGDRVGEAEGPSIVIAVPIARDNAIVGALRAEQQRSVTNRRIEAAWASMGLLAILIFGGSMFLARRLARRISIPIDALRANAQQLGTDGSLLTFERSGLPEVDEVADALEVAVSRVADSVDRERAFSADVSHQLRTPITGLRLLIETEMVAPRADPTVILRESAEVVAQLESTVEQLLSLARNRPTDRAELNPSSLLGDLEQRWRPVLATAHRALDLRNHVVHAVPVVASRSAIGHVLDVLVDNAFRHGEGDVVVTLEAISAGLALRVADGGNLGDIDPEDMFSGRPIGIDVGVAAPRRGIGLGLARRLTQAEGGDLVCTCVDPTTFSVLLARV